MNRVDLIHEINQLKKELEILKKEIEIMNQSLYSGCNVVEPNSASHGVDI